jgi:TRAP-type C4-dicarboxylate transport system permease small subunit
VSGNLSLGPDASPNDSPLVDQNDAGPHEAAPASGPLEALARVLEWVALALFVGMMLTALLQVVLRFSQIPAIWTEELARILFVVSSLLAIAVCVRRREHIVVDYFLDKMSAATRYRVHLVSDVLVLLLLVVWLRGAFRLYALNADATYVTVPWIRVQHVFAVEIVAIVAIIVFVLGDLAARVREQRRRRAQ